MKCFYLLHVLETTLLHFSFSAFCFYLSWKILSYFLSFLKVLVTCTLLNIYSESYLELDCYDQGA